MRLFGMAALAASLLAAAATAAPITYTFAGTLSTDRQFGPVIPSLKTELGAPTSFEASFTFDTALQDLSPLPDTGAFYGGSATIKLDGQLWYTNSGILFQIGDQLIDDIFGGRTLAFSSASASRPGASGPVLSKFALFLVVPEGAVDGDTIPLAGNWVSSFERGYAIASVSTQNGMSAASRGQDSGGQQITSFTVTPVPEPGEWAMMAAGLSVVGAVARRRRKN